MSNFELIVVVLVGPILLALANGWLSARARTKEARIKREEKLADDEARRVEKALDYARQDLVAERLLAATERQEQKLNKIDTTVEANHELANSGHTAQLRMQVTTLSTLKAAIQEIADMRNGEGVSEATLAQIEDTQKRIDAFNIEIAERDRLAADVRKQKEGKVIISDLVVQADDVTVVPPVEVKTP